MKAGFEKISRHKPWMQWCMLFVLASLLSFFHLRMDMAAWSIGCVKSMKLVHLLQFSLAMTHTVLSILGLLLLVVRSRVMAYVVFPVVMFLWVVPTFLRMTMGFNLYSELIFGALGTNMHELSGQLTFVRIAAFVIFVLVTYAMAWGCRTYFPRLQKLPAIWVWSASLLYIGGTTAIVPYLSQHKPEVLIPFVLEPLHGTDAERKFQLETALVHMENEYKPEYPNRVLLPFYRQVAFAYYVYDYYRVPDIKKSEELPSTRWCSDDVVVVLFVGESYRANRSSWNGYHRETCPQLSREKSNIVNFPYFKSYATSTASSIFGILSDASCRNRKATHTSFISILKKHGFEPKMLLCRTTEWQRNPQIHHVLDKKVPFVALCADTAEVVAHVEQISAKTGSQFILLEDGTGHAPYDHELQFARFGNSRDSDKYDNCLLQTDDLLYRIIQTLKDKKAVMLYSSDHGQSFGEQGAWMHGGALSVVQQRHVFSFLWYSDSYALAHPEMIEAVKKNAGKLLSHDDIYTTVLSLSGIECSVPNLENNDFTKVLNRPEVTEFVLDEDK